MPEKKKHYRKPNQLLFISNAETKAINWHPNFDRTESDKASLIHIDKDGKEKSYVHVPFPCMRAFVNIFCKLNDSGYHHRFNVAYFLGVHETDNRVVASFLVYNRRVLVKVHKWSLNTLVIIDEKGSERKFDNFKHDKEDPERVGRYLSKQIKKFRKIHKKKKEAKVSE